jgi:hypothetical protein
MKSTYSRPRYPFSFGPFTRKRARRVGIASVLLGVAITPFASPTAEARFVRSSAGISTFSEERICRDGAAGTVLKVVGVNPTPAPEGALPGPGNGNSATRSLGGEFKFHVGVQGEFLGSPSTTLPGISNEDPLIGDSRFEPDGDGDGLPYSPSYWWGANYTFPFNTPTGKPLRLGTAVEIAGQINGDYNPSWSNVQNVEDCYVAASTGRRFNILGAPLACVDGFSATLFLLDGTTTLGTSSDGASPPNPVQQETTLSLGSLSSVFVETVEYTPIANDDPRLGVARVKTDTNGNGQAFFPGFAWAATVTGRWSNGAAPVTLAVGTEVTTDAVEGYYWDSNRASVTNCEQFPTTTTTTSTTSTSTTTMATTTTTSTSTSTSTTSTSTTTLPPAGPCDAAGVIKGTSNADFLFGTPGSDVICGLGGNDFIFGVGGNDVIYGGAGADAIDGGRGDDTIRGGDGGDLLSGSQGVDSLYGENGNDLLFGGPGVDVLDGGSGSNTIVQ